MSVSKLGTLNMTLQSGAVHTATVIFFHGSGSSGSDMQEWIRLMMRSFNFPHIKILYPTAPHQPYTPMGGSLSNVWFDREDISPAVAERVDSIAEIEKEVKMLIKQENLSGIPSSRIIVGGFSMGGALSFHVAYRWDLNLAGAFVFSSFLNHQSAVYEDLNKAPGGNFPPLLQLHGDSDLVVEPKWALDTFNHLKALGVKGDFLILKKLGHSINRQGIAVIKSFIEKHLPNQ